jgi:hypothetical protein
VRSASVTPCSLVMRTLAPMDTLSSKMAPFMTQFSPMQHNRVSNTQLMLKQLASVA